MTIVRIVRWPGGVPEGSIVTGRDLIVLADDTGRRAVPLWLRFPSSCGGCWTGLAKTP